jgi:hypothetical protein
MVSRQNRSTPTSPVLGRQVLAAHVVSRRSPPTLECAGNPMRATQQATDAHELLG